ncbi:hypothetical protein PV10_00844 [Exophiala mesophila]|uniref:Uncharacterized protein n=1 Tax=Exophiala mesophila TaxID=212818 RepID=A0A0D1ZR37_EXOME|nr:uncharacterized protein PV10_00844 [Exophiala mesophila]KIV97042.1 hypothetical protein PV10_00844 [Exophiala mesophila]
MPSSAFATFWRVDITRECLLSCTPKADLQSLRLTCKTFAVDVAPVLFKSVDINFTIHTFSRRSRMFALDRIGAHVRELTFTMPHHSDTFLPPLLIPGSLEEVRFNYEPRHGVSRPSSSSSSTGSINSTNSLASSTLSSQSSKFGSWEVNDLLVKHYPPLFHAATNVDSFLRAFVAVPNLRHLRISCPNQPCAQRYRRNIVDYALLSVRVAVEQAQPARLDQLTLDPIHPGAIFHLRPQISIGCSPASTRVWSRIKTLNIKMDAFEYGPHQPSDHLKILHSYLASFQSLEQLKFKWLGFKGPCPLSLHLEPCTSRSSLLDCSNACPDASTKSAFRPLKFRRLKQMYLSNARLDATQASVFITSHRKVLHEFQFDECDLRSGTWDDALAPLTRMVGSDAWKEKQTAPAEEVMEIPIMLSPIDEKRAQMDCVNERMWDDVIIKSRHFRTLRRVGSRSKDLVPDQVRKFLRTATVRWH